MKGFDIIKITLGNCVKSYQAINELMDERLDFSTAHALLMAKREIEPHVEFFAEKESELINRYAAKTSDGEVIFNGHSFELDKLKAGEFQKEKLSLLSVEIEITKRTLKNVPEIIKGNVLEGLIYIFDFNLDGGTKNEN